MTAQWLSNRRKQQLVCLMAVALACCALYWLRLDHNTSSLASGVMTSAADVSHVTLLDCPDTNLLCGLKLIHGDEQQDINTLKRDFHRWMSNVQRSVCRKTAHFGGAADGGYEVCVSPAQLEPQKCLVYSFGVRNDWSFDEDISRFGCEVHSFDPSIGMPDHIHPPNVHFHSIGLWGADFVNNQNWTLCRLNTIRKMLGHQQRVIDVLKIDVEGAEWPFLRDLIQSDGGSQLALIGQLLIELHTPRLNPDRLNASDVSEIIYYVQQLDVAGFKVFRNVQRNWCCTRFAPLMPRGNSEKCCHETFYVNTRLVGLH